MMMMGRACGLGGLVVSALDFQAGYPPGGYRGFESRSGRDH